MQEIFISGCPENARLRKGLRREGAFCLAKPFSAETLIKTVEEALPSRDGLNPGPGPPPLVRRQDTHKISPFWIIFLIVVQNPIGTTDSFDQHQGRI